MKKNLLTIILLVTAFAGKAQNLVPNGDFEQFITCPNSISQFNVVTTWINPTTASPDYFNQCSTSSLVAVPDNLFGYQPAHSGDGYAGAYLFEMFDTTGYDYREYMEVPLTSPLVANNCYHFEMYVSLAERLSNYTTGDFGVYFSDSLITGLATQNTLPFIPQVTNSTGYITDTLNWVLIEADYTASGGESHLMIGNFRDDTVIDTLQVGNNSGHSLIYFYVDDVSLSLCTGIEEQGSDSEINIYPNPVKDELIIKSAGKIKEIKMYDATGRKVMEQMNLKSKTLNLKSFQSGIYFIEISDACLPAGQGINVWRQKFLKE